jgi:dihydroneopterin aldolase
VNEVFAFAFGLDPRVQEVSVGLYKQRVSRHASAVGIERTTTRHEYARAMPHATAQNWKEIENVASPE